MATIASKRKLNTKSIKDKYQAYQLQVAAKYGIPKNTLSTWIKNKDKIFEAAKKGMNTKRQRLRAGSYEKLDQAIFKWLLTVRSRDVAVSALILKTKALDFAEKMSIDNFHASDGWLDRWKKLYNVSFKKISGEGNACTDEMTASWAETTLPTMLSKYELNQIYNADEFGLFYRAQPERSLHLKDERCVGGKHTKFRLTGLEAANAAGEKLPMFVIGKSKSPRCFKNIKHLPCRYRSQNKSWMDSILFEEWVCEVDRCFTAEGKKIALVDNCPAHPSIDNLVSVDLFFLAPNTTSKLQPMYQGVIRSLKAYYKSLSVRKLIETIEKNKPLPEFSILDAMRMLDVAWGKVTKETVVNCFAKAGISKEKQVKSLSEADDSFKDLKEQLYKFAVHAPEFFPEGTAAADVVSADDSVINTEPVMTDDEIIFDMLDQDDHATEEGDDDTSYIQPSCPKSDEIRRALEVLREYMLFSENGECIHQCFNQINTIVENELMAKLKQVDIREYFQKK